MILLACLLTVGCSKEKEGAALEPVQRMQAAAIEGDDSLVLASTNSKDEVIKHLFELKNASDKNVEIVEVMVSCSCLTYEGPKSFIIGPGEISRLSLEMKLEAEMGFRKAQLIVRCIDGSTSRFTARSTRGLQFEVIPPQGKLIVEANTPTLVEIMYRSDGAFDKDQITFGLEEGSEIQGYEWRVKTLRKENGSSYFNIQHKFLNGIPPGERSVIIRTFLAGVEKKKFVLSTTGLHATYIPPVTAFVDTGRATSVDLNVPWLNRADVEQISVSGVDIGLDELTESGFLRFRIPDTLLHNIEGLQKLNGIIKLRASKIALFDVILVRIGGGY